MEINCRGWWKAAYRNAPFQDPGPLGFLFLLALLIFILISSPRSGFYFLFLVFFWSKISHNIKKDTGLLLLALTLAVASVLRGF